MAIQLRRPNDRRGCAGRAVIRAGSRRFADRSSGSACARPTILTSRVTRSSRSSAATVSSRGIPRPDDPVPGGTSLSHTTLVVATCGVPANDLIQSEADAPLPGDEGGIRLWTPYTGVARLGGWVDASLGRRPYSADITKQRAVNETSTRRTSIQRSGGWCEPERRRQGMAPGASGPNTRRRGPRTSVGSGAERQR